MYEFIFSITPYELFEDEVLRLRNRNRDKPVTRAYLDWRYLGQKCTKPPLIFWVQDKQGNRVGMVGMIFRPYWVNDKLNYFAVIGDISLNKSLRGKGVGKNLFMVMNEYLIKKKKIAFVIPNVAAQKSLSSVGWKIEESIIPHVFLINPWEKIYQFIKNQLCSIFLGKFFQLLISTCLKVVNTKGITMENVSSIDKSFDLFWQHFGKKHLMIGDKSSAMLIWRYSNHPYNKFKIAKFIQKNQFIGYIVYFVNSTKTTCTIYDLTLSNTQLVKPAIVLFIKSLYPYNSISSIRISLNCHHPYSDILKKTGFFKRLDDDCFQTFSKPLGNAYTASKWFLSSVDKDT